MLILHPTAAPRPHPRPRRLAGLARAASPVIEAMRVGSRYAAMVVHSFSPADAWLEDYRAFARLMGVEGGKGRLERVPRHVGVELWMGWVSG